MFSFSRDNASSGQQRPFPALPKFLTKENILYFVVHWKFSGKIIHKMKENVFLFIPNLIGTFFFFMPSKWLIVFWCGGFIFQNKSSFQSLVRVFRVFLIRLFSYRLCKNCLSHFIILLHANRLRVDDHYVPDEWFIGCIWWLCRQVFQSEYVTGFVNWSYTF